MEKKQAAIVGAGGVIALLALSIIALNTNTGISPEEEREMDQSFFERAGFLADNVFEVHSFMPDGAEELAAETMSFQDGVYITGYSAKGNSFDEFEKSNHEAGAFPYVEYAFVNNISGSEDSTRFTVYGRSERTTDNQYVNDTSDLEGLMRLQVDRYFQVDPSKLECEETQFHASEGYSCELDTQVAGENLKLFTNIQDIYPASFEIEGCISKSGLPKEKCGVSF